MQTMCYMNLACEFHVMLHESLMYTHREFNTNFM